MIPQNRQSALAVLGQLRPTLDRLVRHGDPEDRAADVIEVWNGVETALRQLLGGSSLSGQSLVRELRNRELIGLSQAHALLDLLALRERVDRADYRPTDADVATARGTIAELEVGLSAPPSMSPPPPPPSYQPPPVIPAAAGDLPMAAAPPRKSSLGKGILFGGIALVLALVLVAGYFVYTRGTPERDMERARSLMTTGQREGARAEFMRIARENPELAMPHVYLSRLSRDENDMLTAKREIETAVRLEPQNGLALREMGAVLYADRNYELARRFYVRAIQANPTDPVAQGWLGCTLIRLNRVDEGTKFITRAGAGAWSSCLPARTS